jgi:DNA primase
MSERVLEPWLLIHPYLTEVRGISEDNLMRFKVGFNGESNRIVLPHFFGGALVGWQTRRLVKDGTPKYLSSMDFPKYETLFNYDGSRDVVAAVEAPMTVVAKAHLTHMEATFGAQVTEKQVRLLAKHRRVILAFDNDKAGWKATRAVGDALGSYSEVFVAAHPYAEDLGDLPDEEVSRILDEQVVPYSLWRPPLGLKHFREEVCSE